MDLNIHIQDDEVSGEHKSKLAETKMAGTEEMPESEISIQSGFFHEAYSYIDATVYEAAREGNFDKFVNALDKISSETDLPRSAIFDQVGPSGNSLLHVAARSGHGKITEFIIRVNPSVISKKNIKGDAALHVAARCGMRNTVKILAKADPSSLMQGNEHGDTVLHEAVMNRHHHVVQFLLRFSAADTELICHQNEDGWSPLCMAVKIHDLDIMVLLLEALSMHPCQLNRLERKPPAHVAIMEGRIGTLLFTI